MPIPDARNKKKPALNPFSGADPHWMSSRTHKRSQTLDQGSMREKSAMERTRPKEPTAEADIRRSAGWRRAIGRGVMVANVEAKIATSAIRVRREGWIVTDTASAMEALGNF